MESWSLWNQCTHLKATHNFMGNDSIEFRRSHNPNFVCSCGGVFDTWNSNSWYKIGLALRCFNYFGSDDNHCSSIRQQLHERKTVSKVKRSSSKKKCECDTEWRNREYERLWTFGWGCSTGVNWWNYECWRLGFQCIKPINGLEFGDWIDELGKERGLRWGIESERFSDFWVESHGGNLYDDRACNWEE